VLYPGHSDIIITLDKIEEEPGKGYILSGAKDSEIRLWEYDDAAGEFSKLRCLAVFKGHNQNICTVHFAPKSRKKFVSASQDNTIKLWDIESIIEMDKK